MKEMNDKKELLLIEKNKMPSVSATQEDAGDALDAYMSGLSSQLGDSSFNFVYYASSTMFLVGLEFKCAFVCP